MAPIRPVVCFFSSLALQEGEEEDSGWGLVLLNAIRKTQVGEDEKTQFKME